MDDLIERLRQQGRWYVDNAYNLPLRAADRIEALEAENERLREALEHITDIEPDADNMGRFHDIARAALGEKQ